mgnify:CR=1 FL=1
MENLLEQYRELLQSIGLSLQMATFLENLSVFIAIILLAFLADRITKGILVRSIGHLVKFSKNKYDDILLEKKVFKRIAHIAPALVINATIVFLIDPTEIDPEAAAVSSFTA